MAMAEEEEDWNFDEEQVRREFEAGQLRTARAQELLASQEAVLKRSQTKIRESDEQAQGASPSTPARMRRTEQGMNWLTTPEKPGTSDRARSAAQVSKQMAKRKERSNIVSARQQRMAEEERDYQMRVYTEIEAVEARIQKMQEDFFEEQRRKAFTAQQRRNAQQKAIKEFRREEERLYEAYYSKRTGSQSPRPSRNSSPSRSRSPHPSAQDPSHALATEPGEELYQTILKSHIKYSGTIDKWQQFVQENDRRAEAYRRRVLLPRGKSSPKGGKLALGLPDEVMALFAPPADVCRSLTASPTGLSTIDSFWSGTGPAETDVEGATPKAQDYSSEFDAAPGRREMGREGCSSPGLAASRTSSPKSSSRRLWSRARQLVLGQLSVARKMSPQVWEDRQRRIKQLQVEQELERFEKLEKEEAAMREARVRIDAHTAERSSLASARNKEWQQRNSKAASRRKLDSQRSDAELVRKQDEMQKRLEEEERHLQEVRANMASRRDAHIQSAQNAAAEQIVQMQQSVLGKIELKEQQILKHQQQKVEDLQEKRSKSPSGLTPEEARARKAELEQEFQAKARQETQLKASRSDGHVKAMSSTGFAKMKKLRKEKSAQRPRTQSPPLDDWDGELTKRPASEQPLEGVSSPQKPLQGSQSMGFLPLLVQDQSRPASSVQPQQREKGKEVFRAHQVKQPVGATPHPAFTGPSQPSDAALRRVSVVSLSIDVGGDPLLQEMHERSGFWVKEAKRKKDQSVGKYC